MTSLIAWLLGSGSVPAGPLVWMGGGLCIAVVLTVLLLATMGILAWQHETAPDTAVPSKGRNRLRSTTADPRLPSAA